MSSINGRGYDVLDIANWFHSLPHFGKDLKPISNTTFDPQSEQYVTSLVVYVALPIALMVLILVLYLLVSIIMCCCCTDGQKHKNIRIECKVFIFLFGLVCGLSFVSGLYGDWQMYKGIKSIQNSSQHAVDWVNDIKQNSIRVFEAFKIDQTVTDLKNNITAIKKVPGIPPDKLDPYISYCETISGYLTSSERQVRDANQTLNDVHYEDVPKYVEKYGTLFCIIAVCVLSTLAIIGLVFTFAICSRCILGCFTVLAVISFILSSLLVGTSFGLSVGGSDFCLDDKNWMRTMIPNKDIKDYLIDCIPNNIVSKYMSEAQIFVESAKNTNKELGNLRQFLDQSCNSVKCPEDIHQNINNDLNSMNNSLNDISNLIREFMGLSKCENINTDVNNTLNSICTDIIKGVVMIFFNTIVAAVCFAVIVFSATFALR